MPTWGTVLTGAVTLLGTVIAIYVALRKIGPQIKQMQIQDANSLVEMAKTAAAMTSEVAEDLRSRSESQERRINELSRLLGTAQREIVELRQKAEDVDPLRRKVAELASRLEEVTSQKEALDQENRQLRAEVASLTQQVQHLESEVERFRSDHGEEKL